jgi:DNA polymerase-1
MNRFIIDGFNLLYRSHYAFQKFSTSTGLPSGGVYGFFSILKSLRNKYPDFKFYVVWDNEPKKKKEILGQYKANREPHRVKLPVADIKGALQHLDIIQVECPDEEADDVIAALVSQSNEGKDYIYSSDKDLLQLVKDGRVIVISPKVGTTPEKIYDEEEVKKKWGVKPEDLACLFSFKGDSSDNIPGTSVPSKILALLSTKYKKPTAVYASLGGEKLTDFQRVALETNKDQVFVNHSIIALKKDLSCILSGGKSSPEELRKIFDKYEIKAISAESLSDLFSVQNTFLRRTGPSLKTISLFEEE